jgi:hypothetical protein
MGPKVRSPLAAEPTTAEPTTQLGQSLEDFLRLINAALYVDPDEPSFFTARGSSSHDRQ